MQKIIIEFYRPVVIWATNKEYRQSEYKKFVKEFQQTEFPVKIDDIEFKLNFEFRDDEIKGRLVYAECRVDLSDYIKVLKSNFISAYEKEKLNVQELDFERDTRSMCASEIERVLYNILVTTNIVYPGFLECAGGEIKIDDICYIKIKQVNSSLIFVYEEIEEKKWPELVNISLIDTWNWLNNTVKYSMHIGNTPANRALSAFSFQFNADNY